MDASSLDNLARRLAERRSRRAVAKAVAGVTFALVGVRSADADDETRTQCWNHDDRCRTAGVGSGTVAGRYQLPADAQAIVVNAVVGNFLVAPEFQSGYEIAIDALGHATAAVYPEGSLGSASGGSSTANPKETMVNLGTSGLQRLLADLDARGFFTLPAPHRTAAAGGPVSEATVTLAEGTWVVSSCCLETAEQEERLAAIQRTIAAAVGLVPPGTSTEPSALAESRPEA